LLILLSDVEQLPSKSNELTNQDNFKNGPRFLVQGFPLPNFSSENLPSSSNSCGQAGPLGGSTGGSKRFLEHGRKEKKRV
jgi:hypothetical protein